jgi:2-dehydro-3-deoxy-D-gluconate 5-dehydrogenase
VSILDELRLDSKVALITGSGRGIGEGMAVAFAEAGADLALVSRTEADLERVASKVRALGRKALVLPADVADLQAIPGVIDRVVDGLGGLDILANVAGVTLRKPVLDASPADWDYIMNTNLRAVYFMSQAAGRVMAAQHHGKIINITSMAALRGFEQLSLYGMSKAAVGLLTKVLAVEWAPYNIQANGIAPGWIATSMTASRVNTPEWRVRWIEEQVPQGHFGKPKDVAAVALFLASAASDFCTGQVFATDGGFSAGNPDPKKL